MSLSQHLPKFVIAVVLLGGGAVIASKALGPSPSNGGMVTVKVPDLSTTAKVGKALFDENCAACHGDNAAGNEGGPPLIHTTYNPGHHGDAAFQAAAQRGVQRHHWNFGDMPPQPQINPGQMANIIFYVRELQMANGIFYQEHKM